MLWYGFCYLVFLCIITILTFFFSIKQIFQLSYSTRFFNTFLCKIVLPVFIFFILFSAFLLYQLLLNGVLLTSNSHALNIMLIETFNTRFSFGFVETKTSLLQIYYFPFLYIFLFVTFLSIIFCLSYNIQEFTSFLLYCIIILLAGYILFFTDNLIIFFFCLWITPHSFFFYSL